MKLPVRILGGASPPRTPPSICFSIWYSWFWNPRSDTSTVLEGPTKLRRIFAIIAARDTRRRHRPSRASGSYTKCDHGISMIAMWPGNWGGSYFAIIATRDTRRRHRPSRASGSYTKSNTHPTVAKNAIHYYVINAFDFCFVLNINLPLFNFGDYPQYRSAPLFHAPYRGSSHQTCLIVFLHLAFDQSDVTPVSRILRLAIVQWQQVATSGIQCQQVASSVNRCQQVAPGGSAIAFRFAPRRPN